MYRIILRPISRAGANPWRQQLQFHAALRRPTSLPLRSLCASYKRSEQELGKNKAWFEVKEGGEEPDVDGFTKRRSGESYLSYVAQRVRETPVSWRPLPIWVGAALLVLITYLKSRGRQDAKLREGERDLQGAEAGVKIEGPWQVKVLGALPLRSISRLYGLLNSYELPVWFRVPGYRFYAFLFGVNIDEAEIQDLKQHRSLQEFFLRRLKDGVRPIAGTVLVSPADGKVVNFGIIEERRVASVKGMSYSLDALLAGQGSSSSSTLHLPPSRKGEETLVSDAHFAEINDVPYSIDELMGDGQVPAHKVPHDASVPSSAGMGAELRKNVEVATSVAKGELEGLASAGLKGVPRDGNRMYFAVVYLAPGDYHRFHSSANWVVERRRHFAGELFSVSPWMVGKLADLFVLNERVALLGRWRHGFFSMTPVGATNVGSILINFDSQLRTNSPHRPLKPGTFAEAVYSNANRVLGGQPVSKGEEMGGFSLGSTIVLVFEAPEEFKFLVEKGQKVKYGQAMGQISPTS